MSSFVFFIYKYILAPIVYVLLQLLRPFLSGKLREMIEDKNHSLTNIKSSLSEDQIRASQPIWIHAASGEIEYARPVIRELKKRFPEIPLLVTYTSPSAKKILAQIPEVDVWASLPWDLSSSVQHFISRWNPRMLLFSRTDVWPVLAEVAHKNSVPMMLFSATFAENSSRLKGISRFLTRHTLGFLDEVHCVSAEDIQNLDALALKTSVVVSGDTRFDQVFHRLENPRALKNELMPSPEDFIFIAGSSWPEDETVLVTALAKLKGLYLRSIIAPHETHEEHLTSLEAQLDSAGLKHVRYSKALQWHGDEILIIDQVGILAELYTWADVAFIGGSFKKQVHSVMEALAAGLPVMVGPHHQNNREALFYQKKSFSSGMIVQVVHSPEDVVVLLQRMKKLQQQWPHIKEEIRSEVGKNKKSTLRVMASIEKILES
ncbi:hypothetical protein AZI86_15575 [Bdellovibrio bacteriovorus]|uniref:3-deoxy-D-manno-octulosonic acid transferase n=1 Tax=Bdellovibrio bacteriovorus TaxID=959 RepID=A0A150WHI0_BDEBC|nr:glycosyltransferase N-terminal domain-containing protein [Bdellovibrio bacteriovorus]KYG63132.1 hypothetical protein AZI86_15575 [Bdellovibrio bacteriovorus]